MKPETKFRRAFAKLAKEHGVTAQINEYMSGGESKTRTFWKTFILKTSQDAVPSAFLQAVEKLNTTVYDGVHELSNLPIRVELAVRVMKLDGRYFNFKDTTLIAQS